MYCSTSEFLCRGNEEHREWVEVDREVVEPIRGRRMRCLQTTTLRACTRSEAAGQPQTPISPRVGTAIKEYRSRYIKGLMV